MIHGSWESHGKEVLDIATPIGPNIFGVLLDQCQDEKKDIAVCTRKYVTVGTATTGVW